MHKIVEVTVEGVPTGTAKAVLIETEVDLQRESRVASDCDPASRPAGWRWSPIEPGMRHGRRTERLR